jgi:hypothetical protein
MKIKNKRNMSPQHQKRLDCISAALKEMRFAEGKNQDGFVEVGISRRQIQHVEQGNNISLVRLFTILDCYGYSWEDLNWTD